MFVLAVCSRSVWETIYDSKLAPYKKVVKIAQNRYSWQRITPPTPTPNKGDFPWRTLCGGVVCGYRLIITVRIGPAYKEMKDGKETVRCKGPFTQCGNGNIHVYTSITIICRIVWTLSQKSRYRCRTVWMGLNLVLLLTELVFSETQSNWLDTVTLALMRSIEALRLCT